MAKSPFQGSLDELLEAISGRPTRPSPATGETPLSPMKRQPNAPSDFDFYIDTLKAPVKSRGLLAAEELVSKPSVASQGTPRVYPSYMPSATSTKSPYEILIDSMANKPKLEDVINDSISQPENTVSPVVEDVPLDAETILKTRPETTYRDIIDKYVAENISSLTDSPEKPEKKTLLGILENISKPLIGKDITKPKLDIMGTLSELAKGAIDLTNSSEGNLLLGLAVPRLRDEFLARSSQISKEDLQRESDYNQSKESVKNRLAQIAAARTQSELASEADIRDAILRANERREDKEFSRLSDKEKREYDAKKIANERDFSIQMEAFKQRAADNRLNLQLGNQIYLKELDNQKSENKSKKKNAEQLLGLAERISSYYALVEQRLITSNPIFRGPARALVMAKRGVAPDEVEAQIQSQLELLKGEVAKLYDSGQLSNQDKVAAEKAIGNIESAETLMGRKKAMYNFLNSKFKSLGLPTPPDLKANLGIEEDGDKGRGSNSTGKPRQPFKGRID
jgi:hypothetical protein